MRAAPRGVCVGMLCLLPLKVGGLFGDRLGLFAIRARFGCARAANVAWLW
jgi:hypothetical protein